MRYLMIFLTASIGFGAHAQTALEIINKAEDKMQGTSNIEVSCGIFYDRAGILIA